MKSLYLRIYATVLVAVALFAVLSGWLLQQHLERERGRQEVQLRERAQAWGELLQRALPEAGEPPAEQQRALAEWSQRLRLPLALDGPDGRRVAASESFQRRTAEADAGEARQQSVTFDDGRVLRVLRPGRGARPGGARAWPDGARPVGALGPGLALLGDGRAVVVLLLLLFAGVAAGAWPVVRRLTRRLEALQRGVDAFGAGALQQRVAEDGGRDEVAALAASFNRAAARIEALVRSHQSLLANASHELRSPLARLKMAVALAEELPPGAARAALQREIDTDIAELDALVEEVLMASRLDAAGGVGAVDDQPVELLAVAAEEAARTGAEVSGQPMTAVGEERLLRRAVRNLLENARRYGGGSPVTVTVASSGASQAELRVDDGGPGVPPEYRERIFEAFFRLPGHAEREGGVGLGLSLVRQIARRHGGQVRCEPRAGGGSSFVLTLPRMR